MRNTFLKKLFRNTTDSKFDGQKTLYIHLGMGKTGSKWIQKYLGLNRENLLNQGFFYPISDFENPDSITELTTGLGIDFFVDENSRNSILNNWLDSRVSNLVISSEFLFNHFLFQPEDFQQRIKSLIREEKCRVKALLFIRDIEKLIISSAKQYIKVGDADGVIPFELRDTNSVINNIQHLYMKWIEIIDFFEQTDNAELKVLNYSRHKENLKVQIDNYLGIDGNFMKVPQKSIINRSLTAGEFFLIEELNNNLNEKIDLGISLTNNVDEVFSDADTLTPDLLDEIWSKTTQLRLQLNNKLVESERIKQSEINVQSNNTFTFTKQQIKEIVRLISIRINKTNNEIDTQPII